MLCVVNYFASTNYPYRPSDIIFRRCLIDGAKSLMRYRADRGPLESGTHWGTLTLEDVRLTGLAEGSVPLANAEEPLTVFMKNVSYSFREGCDDSELIKLSESENTTVIGR